MGLLDIVRSGVAIANSLTADLQPTVLREAVVLPLTQDVYGEPVRSAAVATPAIVEMKLRMVRSSGGELVSCRATVTFLDPAVVVHLKDKLTLPDGTSGPILDAVGMTDRGTGKPFLTQVYIGAFE